MFRGRRGLGSRQQGQTGRNNETRIEHIPPEKLDFQDGVASIPDLATYEKLSYQGTDLKRDTHLVDWKFLKFQIEDVGYGKAVIYFINTKTHRGHPIFMRKITLCELLNTLCLRLSGKFGFLSYGYKKRYLYAV